jgi:replicative superfamily II helicase
MAEIATATVERLEELAAWHRANAAHAGSPWVWEARLLTAEELERQAAELRARLSRPIGKLRAALKG